MASDTIDNEPTMGARKRSRLNLMGRNHLDDLQTPDWVVIALINALPDPLNGIVWEPAVKARL